MDNGAVGDHGDNVFYQPCHLHMELVNKHVFAIVTSPVQYVVVNFVMDLMKMLEIVEVCINY